MRRIMLAAIVLLFLAVLSCERPEEKKKECRHITRMIVKSIMIACADPAFVTTHGYLDAADCTSKELSEDMGVFVYIMNCTFCDEDEEACL